MANRPTLAGAIRIHAIDMGRRVAALGSGFARIAGDIRGRFDSAVLKATADYMAARPGGLSERLTALRRDTAISRTLDAAYDDLLAAGVRAVLDEQASIYRTDQERRAAVYEAYTQADVHVVADVTPAELAALVKTPVSGMTVQEWGVSIADRWFDGVTRAATSAFSGERGDIGQGLKAAGRAIDAVFATWVTSMTKLSQSAGYAAIRQSNAEFSKAFGGVRL